MVDNGHIYSSIKEEEVVICWAYFNIFCGSCRLRILWAGVIIISNWIISQRNIVFGIYSNYEHAMKGELFPYQRF